MARRGAVFLGLVAGLAVGWFVAERHMGRHRQDLFSARPLRRFAALGALAASGGVETAGLLRDYLEWEVFERKRQGRDAGARARSCCK